MSKKAATGQPLAAASGRRRASLDFIAGGGEMGARLRDFDWSQHPLGLPETWQQSLRTAVNLMLNSRYPMFVWWGKQLFNFYNDAYTPMLGKRHPDALGKPAADIWSEIWDVVGPQTDIVLNTGRATWNEEQLLVMERNGFVEEAHFSFSYSPVLDDASSVGGVFCAVTEDTGRVLGRRRLRTLRDLAVATVGARGEAETCRQATDALETNRHDLPFGLIYLLGEQTMSARLVSTTGIAAGGAASPLEISLSETSTPWPLDLIFRSGHSDVLRPLPSGLGPLPGGPWPDSPTSAIILPIRQPSQGAPVGFFIAGISARLAIDDDYLDFLGLLAGQIGTAISDARAYEAEHRRAEALAEIDRAKTERLLAGIAAQAAVAIDNGRLFQAAKAEIAERDRGAQALREGEERLQQANTELGRRLEEIQAAHAEVQEARRAALNLMEDAVESRQVAETLNAALRDSERRFREMIDALPTAIYTTDADGRITHFNPAAVEFSGRTPKIGIDQWCVSWKLYHPDGRPMPQDECPMAVALKEGRVVRGAEGIIERPDGSRRWFTPYPTPLRNHEGRIVGGINMVVDITERKQAEMATASLAAIVRSSDDAIISKDLSGIIKTWNTGAERLFGYTAEEAIGKPITLLIPPDREQEEPEILARLRAGEHVDHFETVRIRKDGSQVEVSLTISPLKDSSGRVIGASKIARDVSERNAAQRREQVLTNELAHRGKNLLGVVQALISRSLSGERSLDEASEVLSRRIQALAHSQSVLEGGASAGASVAEIIRLEFEAFSERVEADGPDTMLNPKAAQMFALVVHELATNATKYGALSNPEGQVSIRWSIEGAGPERRFVFRWQERGGPPVEPPTHNGFGRSLIEQAVPQDFQSTPQINFAPEGLSYEIDAPLSAVAQR